MIENLHLALVATLQQESYSHLINSLAEESWNKLCAICGSPIASVAESHIVDSRAVNITLAPYVRPEFYSNP